MLLRKDPNKEDVIEKFRTITLFNTGFNILIKVLTKRLALVGSIVEDAVDPQQTYL